MTAAPARALGVASLVVVPVLALVDTLLVPRPALAESGFDVVSMLVVSMTTHVVVLAPLLVVLAVFIGGTIFATKRSGSARWLAALASTTGILCAIVSHIVLIQYERFIGHLPFIAAWLALGVYLSVAYRLLLRDTSRRLRLGLATIGVAGTVVAAWANLVLYPAGYPTLHRGLVTVMFLLAHASVALALMSRSVRARGPVRLWAPLAIAGLLVVAMLGSALASARAITLYRNFTVLGRASVIDARETMDTCFRPPRKLGAPEAQELFARHSRLPDLPATFRLADYNVMLVTIETLRFDDTSLGGRAGATPTLERMIADGAYAFDDAMSPSSGTLQSIASLLTLTYPTHTPVVIELPRWTGALRPGTPTLPEIFRTSGYTTFAALHALFPAALRGGERGFDHLWIQPDFKKRLTSDEQLVDWTIEALDRIKASGTKFFGWTFLIGPHDPYLHSGRETEHRDRYRKEITHVDAQLGRIYDHLRATGLLDTTIVIVMGDHGEEFGEHGMITAHSFTLYDEVLHVPAVVLLPQVKGSRIPGVTSTLYLFPWLLTAGDEGMAAAGNRAITEDLGPMLQEVDGAVVAELVGVDRRSVALIWEDRKVIHGAYSNFVQMFDRRTDRTEQTNLALRDFPFKREVEAIDRYQALRACRQRTTEVRQLFVPAVNTTRRDDIRLR